MVSKKAFANSIRILSIDAIQKANSGHPGAPMGMADIAEVLWRNYMKHNPLNPNWINRDRFILSNGHASILLYSILHLTGYNLSIEDLKNFRQLHSRTPGHPECNHTEGVEITTGPLGQGIANAVGLAIAERTLAEQFNRPGYNIIDHYTYVFLGDGCMMEGISHEASSLAGTMKLGKLIAFYDDNGISIDGNIKEWCNDDTAARFVSYGWHVIKDINGHNSDEINKAIYTARKIKNQPSLLMCKTIIAFGSPNKAGSNVSHGQPLGDQEIIAVRKMLKWNEPSFFIPKDIYQGWDARKTGKLHEIHWKKIFYNYKKAYPELAQEFERRIHGKLPLNWYSKNQEFINYLQKNINNISARKASQNALEFFYSILPELFGGSADLSSSNLTMCSKTIPITSNIKGNYIHYGIREFGMTAIGNGIARHTGFIPYTATFLVFSDYACNAIRMAALMNIQHIMIYTHDSIGIGEDGPTHQPIEQLSSLRMIPNITVWRPCDTIETTVAWRKAIEHYNGPTILVLSRQVIIQQQRNTEQLLNIEYGGYILKDCNGQPELILIATGSEVNLAIEAYQQLVKDNYKVRVVSMPSTNIFDKQSIFYRESVLPKEVTARIAIEASFTDFWYKYVGLEGEIIGMKTFGCSGKSEHVFKLFNFTVDHILNKARKLLKLKH